MPFWREIYEAFSVESPYERIVVVCGSQMAKTEGIFNILGQRFTDGPFVPAMYVGPTEKQVLSIMSDRVDKMLRSTPVLWDRTEKGQRYKTTEKFIAGVRFGAAWAGSATELASHPCGLVLVDERDRMDSDAGNEGDPVKLAEARMKNFWCAKSGIFSTPTLEGASPIWSLLEQGTMMFWAWPCIGCGVYFVPELSLLHWDKAGPAGEEMTADQRAATAHVACPKCGQVHRTRDRDRINANGAFLPHRRLADTERTERPVLAHYVQVEKPAATSTASFWISGLASPWVRFEKIAKELIDAYASAETETIQAVVNTMGGELFRVKGEAPKWEEVGANRSPYPPHKAVPGVQRITMGVDVQRDCLYYVIRGWGYMSESWLIENGQLAGDTEFDAVWQALRERVQRQVGDRQIDRAFVDSGYRPGDVHRRPDHAVYTFARSMPGVVFPTKGQDALQGAPFQFRHIDYSRGGTVVKGGVKLCHINTDFFKRWIHGRVRWPEGQPGAWHLHEETSEEYCRHIVSEELVLKASGRATWVRKSRANHYLDCEVNATAAAYSLNVHQLPQLAGRQAQGNAPPLPNPPPSATRGARCS